MQFCQNVTGATSLHFIATAQREIGFGLSSSSNSEPNLLQLVSLKRDCKVDRLLFVCLLFHQQSSIIVITLIFGSGTISSILVELHKMIERSSESRSSSNRSGWYGRPRRRGLALGESRRGDVTRSAGFKVAAPWGCRMEHHRRREVELRRRCDAMSVQPLWWSRVGISFVQGVCEDDAVRVMNT